MSTRATLRLIATVLICTWLPSNTWGAPPPAALVDLPLSVIPVPVPPNLFQFVKNKPEAIKLGKAFYWDMQAGSDGITACASCHFSAGADNRLKNTVNPGTRAGDFTFQVRGPNETLNTTHVTGDFPFHQRQNPDFQASPVIREFNDVVGSQGVKLADFAAITAGSAEDVPGTPVSDTVFHAGGVNMRQVTARNTPSVINAVFNFNNFWDGRAHSIFNGVNPFGPLDTTAGVWFSDTAGTTITKMKIALECASLASQATGPPLDTTEMSFRGRTFPQLARKMLSLTPLGKQVVHPNDSVLGPLSRAVIQNGKVTGQPGLNASYEQMIKDSFLDTFWKSSQLTPDGFTQMEANFSLFWGLAIQLYESTLVSDQTPFDRLLGGDQTALTTQQVTGMNIFFGQGHCDICHAGTELTSASVTAAAFTNNISNGLIDQMPVASGMDTIYDLGYNATSVRPMADDVGRGGDSPFTNPFTGLLLPLGFSELAEIQAVGNLPFASIVLSPQLPVDFPVSNGGAFKVPSLRNVELTAPYFHNGSVMTLEDVADFYTRGGNYPSFAHNPDLDFNIIEFKFLENAPEKMAAMAAFLKSLTDERVRNHSAPFDHPELFVPEGADADGKDIMTRIPARDANGVAAPAIALTLNPVYSPTNQTNQLISGTVDIGSTLTVTVDTAATVGAVSITDTTWSVQISGLVPGANNITVTANATTTLTANITVDMSTPLLTLAPVFTPTGTITQTLSGTVEAGITPLISCETSATVGAVTVSSGNWSAQISNLAPGANFIVIAAVDSAGNFVARTANINFSTTMSITDALNALRIAVGLAPSTPADMALLDVAAPNGTINIADALMVLRKVVGLVTI